MVRQSGHNLLRFSHFSAIQVTERELHATLSSLGTVADRETRTFPFESRHGTNPAASHPRERAEWSEHP